MKKIKVTPINIKTGAKAPSYIISVPTSSNLDLYKLAISEAKTLSRLSSFDNWSFEVN